MANFAESAVTELKARVHQGVKQHLVDLVDISETLHANPELGYEEFKAAEHLSSHLESAGFSVERGIANLPTAFKATIGSGPLHIGICAEYDALPGIGHACGHNLIAASTLGAALALQPLRDELGITVSVIGTPAEEGGGGKVLLLQGGAFDGLSAALMAHPAASERVAMDTLAVATLRIEYFGVASHASARPEAGISASAALALAQSGIAFLREHIHATDRIHGIVDKGGDAPNIVPEHTVGRFFVRSATFERLTDLEQRVIEVFKGAAMMTGAKMRVTKTGPNFSDLRTDQDLATLWQRNAQAIGRDSLDIQPDDPGASTDMGNVSYAVPSIHPLVSLPAGGANIHEQAFEKAAKGNDANQWIADASTLLAQTVIDAATDPQIHKRLASKQYRVDDERSRDYLDEDWKTPLEFDPNPLKAGD